MSKELFIFDHDGTLTDPETAHDAYTDIFEKQFSQATGLPRGVVTKYIEPERNELRVRPEVYGWKNHQGFVVASASFDTIVLNRVATERAIAKMRQALEPGLPDEESITQFLGGIEATSYRQIDSFYRPDAAYTIKEILPLGKLVIISGSNPNHILRKLQPFLDSNNIPMENIEVRGDAHKNLISPNWNRVPWSMKMPGLHSRDVLLRREHYGNIILSLEQHPYVVVGNGGEFDLVTPHALQMDTVLLTSSFTPHWEANFFKTQNSLEGVANQIITGLGK